ncbi:uncharacterized protein [Antennarius striatus]|uniref:uncharacterized protein n=1 Tax=Antennarius striatus TaxID=241820 RepID=UPI0035B3D0B9
MLKCYHDEEAQAILDAALTLTGIDDGVIHHHHHLDLQTPRSVPEPYPDIVKIGRRKLITRTWSVDLVMDALQDQGFLNTAKKEVISICGVQMDKNRALVDMLPGKGNKAHIAFYKALSQSDPFFLQELQDDLNTEFLSELESSGPPVSTDILDFLVLDEFKYFQWLVSDHMSGGNLPPTGEEPLQHSETSVTLRLLGKQLDCHAVNVMQKIVPTIGFCLPGQAVTSQRLPDIREESADTPAVELTPEVFEDCHMFRLRCQQMGVFRCSLTGLLLEGVGDVVYQIIPWDVGFLSSKGLRPAGPLFRFTLLTGSFHRLHLPHCQLLADGGRHSLSVAHVTVNSVDIITPGQVTEGHVIISISSFSCFGLVAPEEWSTKIKGLMLLFHQPRNNLLFVVLLPRNICLTQVMKEWKRRTGAEYVESIPDCELIPNQSYKLSGEAVVSIHPEPQTKATHHKLQTSKSSKFLNFNDYTNFLPSFQVHLAADVRTVALHLKTHVNQLRLIGWLFGPSESVVWQGFVNLTVAVSSLSTEDSVDVTLLLLKVLNSIGLDDVKTFQRLLSLYSDPIPVSRLEAADRTRTVDLMVQQYQTEGAKQVAEEILRMMDYNQLADQLQRK